MYARGLRFVKLRQNWPRVRAKKVFTNRHPCARFVNKNCYLPSENLPAKLLLTLGAQGLAALAPKITPVIGAGSRMIMRQPAIFSVRMRAIFRQQSRNRLAPLT